MRYQARSEVNIALMIIMIHDSIVHIPDSISIKCHTLIMIHDFLFSSYDNDS